MDRGDHACVIYSTRGELISVITPYLVDGLAASEQCWYAASSGEERAHVRSALEARGIDVAGAERRAALHLEIAADLYFAGGAFNPEQMLGRLSDLVAVAERSNFTGFRLGAEMSWMVDPKALLDEVIEYEAQVGSLLSTSGAIGLCLYHADRIPAYALNGSLTTHPLAAVGGAPQPNRFYRSKPADDLHAFRPDELAWKLKELRARKD